MNLQQLKEHWDAFGESDPLWAVLTHPDRKGNRWDPEEFFKSGREEIAVVMRYLDEREIKVEYGSALDFGCGVGRLSQALCAHFTEVCGVDIAPSMIAAAERFNCYSGRCQYVLNEREDLRVFPDNRFDFIYSNIVLQHMKKTYAKGYIKEFLRIVKPGGIVLFQQPNREKPTASGRGVRMRVRNLARALLPTAVVDLYRNAVQAGRDGGPVMEMYEIRRNDLVAFLERAGARVIDICEDPDWCAGWTSVRYCFTKMKKAAR